MLSLSDSIKSNIKFGKEDATDEEVESAAKSAVVHDNIIGFKKQYETVLGERELHFPEDKTKSVYRQSDIKNPPILLFDDCLSAVDTETEETILNNLNEICKDKTTIIVSHRVLGQKCP
jgi:ATP-binding cassette subfamily B protein